MSTDETREALAAMVREGKAAGMYEADHPTTDHGAAGFCAHAIQPADRPCGHCGGPPHDPADCIVAQQAEAQRLCDEDRHYAEDDGGADCG